MAMTTFSPFHAFFQDVTINGIYHLSLPMDFLITQVQIPPSTRIFNQVFSDHQFRCPLNEDSGLFRT